MGTDAKVHALSHSRLTVDDRKEIEMLDANGGLLFSLNTKLPDHLRERLEWAVELCLLDTNTTF